MTVAVTVRGITIPPEELSWRFSRSAGPGGQSVNTTDSQAELTFNLAASAALPPILKDRALAALSGRMSASGSITVAASEFRSQLRNREAAAVRLSALLTEATTPPRPARRPTRPTRGSVERRLAEKRRRSQVKRQRRADGGPGPD